MIFDEPEDEKDTKANKPYAEGEHAGVYGAGSEDGAKHREKSGENPEKPSSHGALLE